MIITLHPTGHNAPFRDPTAAPVLRHDAACAAVVLQVGMRERAFSLRSGRELQVPQAQQQWILSAETAAVLRAALGLPPELGDTAADRFEFYALCGFCNRPSPVHFDSGLCQGCLALARGGYNPRRETAMERDARLRAVVPSAPPRPTPAARRYRPWPQPRAPLCMTPAELRQHVYGCRKIRCSICGG